MDMKNTDSQRLDNALKDAQAARLAHEQALRRIAELETRRYELLYSANRHAARAADAERKRDQALVRIAELERTLDRYSKEDGSGLVQRQQARIEELVADLQSWHKGGRYLRLEQERDQARQECERLRAELETGRGKARRAKIRLEKNLAGKVSK